MKNDRLLKDKLVELAYEFYPRDISDREDAYYQSKEHLNLIQSRANKDFYSNQWNLLLSKINENYSSLDYRLENWMETATVDRCYVGRIIRKDHTLNFPGIVFNISFVAPIYILYNSGNVSRSFSINKLMLSEYNFIKKLIKEIFPTHIELSNEIAKTEIRHITFDGLGLLSFEKSDIVKNMTIFNAFFSNSFY